MLIMSTRQPVLRGTQPHLCENKTTSRPFPSFASCYSMCNVRIPAINAFSVYGTGIYGKFMHIVSIQCASIKVNDA
jgi:hypothetical protein